MGTWGTGPFDNHAARDVLDSLRDGSFDLRHFQRSCGTGVLDSDEAEAVIALGALTKLPADGLPDGVAPRDLTSLYTPQSKAWLRRRINQAMRSESSSVYALWEPTGELNQWLHTAQAALP
ncbi:DUF4259 domain-containing protein [Corynebacterium sp. ACRPS]|uniref:DUF4259 domain-containing protein n=1 Tax=Corynebacterium sp. ACRPS TaxID=2918194 RepID=UPI001EF55ACD|nr:DUF4259 domain-containing protein [Corynebacterium sp. ACRPS]